MAELIWTEPALSDLDTIADYIALDNQRQHAILSGEYFVMWNSWPSTRRAAHGPKSCALRGIGRSLSRPVAFSIATMESEPLFCTSCAGRCACAGVSSSRETDGTGRPNRIKNSREFRVGGPPPSGRHSPVFALVPHRQIYPPSRRTLLIKRRQQGKKVAPRYEVGKDSLFFQTSWRPLRLCASHSDLVAALPR